MKMPSPTEMNLLTALGAREISGRDLAKRYEQETGSSISYGTLYTTMRRLKDSGWVEVREAETEDRRVRYFKISGAGAKIIHQVRLTQELLGGEGVVA